VHAAPERIPYRACGDAVARHRQRACVLVYRPSAARRAVLCDYRRPAGLIDLAAQ
jgi:hypothetical protein